MSKTVNFEMDGNFRIMDEAWYCEAIKNYLKRYEDSKFVAVNELGKARSCFIELELIRCRKKEAYQEKMGFSGDQFFNADYNGNISPIPNLKIELDYSMNDFYNIYLGKFKIGVLDLKDKGKILRLYMIGDNIQKMFKLESKDNDEAKKEALDIIVKLISEET